jgi:hypothetical protein
MRTLQIEKALIAYEASFADFCRAYQLPEQWFGRPDHIAIKAANLNDYEETRRVIEDSYVYGAIWEVSMDERLLGSGKLLGSLSLVDYDFQWVEIMQPRPGKETEKGFVEHTEFVFPDFYEVARILHQRGLTEGEDFERQSNDGHAWLNVVLDKQGHEIKFNDKPLAEVVAEEKATAGKKVQ